MAALHDPYFYVAIVGGMIGGFLIFVLLAVFCWLIEGR